MHAITQLIVYLNLQRGMFVVENPKFGHALYNKGECTTRKLKKVLKHIKSKQIRGVST